jgi:methylglutamate dehydrogenase subunit D
MLKASSALASAKPYVSTALTIVEAPEFALTQHAGSEKELKKVLGKLPAKVGVAHDNFLRIGPKQIWQLSLNRHPRAGGDPAGLYTTELSSSRTRIEISGAPARAVLAKCAAIDFSVKNFKPTHFVMTGIHHVPVLVHCIGADQFHIYVLRTFALSVWDYLTDAGLEFK